MHTTNILSYSHIYMRLYNAWHSKVPAINNIYYIHRRIYNSHIYMRLHNEWHSQNSSYQQHIILSHIYMCLYLQKKHLEPTFTYTIDTYKWYITM